MLSLNFFRSRNRKGAAALPVILLLGGIVVELGIAGSVLLFYLNNSLYGTLLASRALYAAQSGVNEAVYRIVLNKGFSGNLSLDLGDSIADVDISQDCVSYGPDNCRVTITSVGSALSREHRIEAMADVDSDTGEVDILTIKELDLGA